VYTILAEHVNRHRTVRRGWWFENFPSYAQIISASTTESSLTGKCQDSYNLSAQEQSLSSDVPVMGIQEDDSSNDEHNFFGLRHFAGFVTGEAVVVLPLRPSLRYC
jgi:hypothetical protein